MESNLVNFSLAGPMESELEPATPNKKGNT